MGCSRLQNQSGGVSFFLWPPVDLGSSTEVTPDAKNSTVRSKSTNVRACACFQLSRQHPPTLSCSLSCPRTFYDTSAEARITQCICYVQQLKALILSSTSPNNHNKHPFEGVGRKKHEAYHLTSTFSANLPPRRATLTSTPRPRKQTKNAAVYPCTRVPPPHTVLGAREPDGRGTTVSRE